MAGSSRSARLTGGCWEEMDSPRWMTGADGSAEEAFAFAFWFWAWLALRFRRDELYSE